jgi:hypothetical protein
MHQTITTPLSVLTYAVVCMQLAVAALHRVCTRDKHKLEVSAPRRERIETVSHYDKRKAARTWSTKPKAANTNSSSSSSNANGTSSSVSSSSAPTAVHNNYKKHTAAAADSSAAGAHNNGSSSSSSSKSTKTKKRKAEKNAQEA